MRRYFDKAVAVTAIHPELRNVNVVRERHRLDRLITDARVFRRHVVPRCRCQPADNDHTRDGHLQWQPIAPAWKKIRHKISGLPRCPTAAANLKLERSAQRRLPRRSIAKAGY